MKEEDQELFRTFWRRLFVRLRVMRRLSEAFCLEVTSVDKEDQIYIIQKAPPWLEGGAEASFCSSRCDETALGISLS